MEDENDTGAAEPLRVITVNQVVAWNIGHLRRAAGLTQRELGSRLGWTNVAVSEAERSFDGRRPRLFNAQELTELALALGVPLAALFLPPADDGIEVRYVIAAPGEDTHYMADYMELCVMPDSDEDTLVMNHYRDRFTTAMSRYLAPDWAAQAATWLSESRTPAARTDLAGRLRDRELALLETAAELRELGRAIMEGAQ